MALLSNNNNGNCSIYLKNKPRSGLTGLPLDENLDSSNFVKEIEDY